MRLLHLISQLFANLLYLLWLIIQTPLVYCRYVKSWARFWLGAFVVSYRKMKLREVKEAERRDRLLNPARYRCN